MTVDELRERLADLPGHFEVRVMSSVGGRRPATDVQVKGSSFPYTSGTWVEVS